MPQITQSDIFGDPSLWTPLDPYGGTPLGAYPATYGLGQTGYGQQGPSLGGQPAPYVGGAGGYQPGPYGGGAAGYQPRPFNAGALVGGGGGGQPQSFQDSGGGALTTGLGALSALSAADRYLLDGQLGESAREFLGNIPGVSNIAELFGLGPDAVPPVESIYGNLPQSPLLDYLDPSLVSSVEAPPSIAPLTGPATSMRHIAPPGSSFVSPAERASFAELMDAGGVPTGAPSISSGPTLLDAPALPSSTYDPTTLIPQGGSLAGLATGAGALGGLATQAPTAVWSALPYATQAQMTAAGLGLGGGGYGLGTAAVPGMLGAALPGIAMSLLPIIAGMGQSQNSAEAMRQGTAAAVRAFQNLNFNENNAARIRALTGLPGPTGQYGDRRTLESGANIGGIFNQLEQAGGRAALSPSAQSLYDDLRNYQVVLQERKNTAALERLGLPADVVRPDPVPFYSPGQAGGQPSLPVPDYRQIQPYDPRLLQQVMPSTQGQTYGSTLAGRLLSQGMSPSQVEEYVMNVGQ